MTAGALGGIRVVDVSAAVAGPWSSTQLGDHGADVILVEPVDRPDVMRVTGPIIGDVSGSWVAMNRNKRAIALNLRDERGLDLLLRLVDTADVFVQNFRPGVAERLGIGYNVLAARNPRLVYVSVSGYGPDGPYVGRPVYDPIIQAVSGLVDNQGGTLVKNVIADKVTALTAANAALAALVSRGLSGKGQHVEVNMLDATLAFSWLDTGWNHAMPEAEPVPTYTSWYEPFTTSDGQVTLAWPTDDKFRRAVLCLGIPALAEDDRFATRAGRVRNGAALVQECRSRFAALTTEEALALLQAADVPSAAVLTLKETLVDPQVLHNRIIEHHDHPVAGPIRVVRPPARMSDTPFGVTRLAPSFGEHTDAVLEELGVDAATLAVLRADRVVA